MNLKKVYSKKTKRITISKHSQNKETEFCSESKEKKGTNEKNKKTFQSLINLLEHQQKWKEEKNYLLL